MTETSDRGDLAEAREAREDLRRPAERAAVADTVTAMLHAVDTLDWQAVRTAFAPTVTADYSSLFGGGAEELPAGELVGRWRRLLPGFDATQHLTGPVLVAPQGGGEARAATDVRGLHRFDAEEGPRYWTVSGRYLLRARRQSGRWRITALTLVALAEEGDRGLLELAAERVRAGAGGRTGAG